MPKCLSTQSPAQFHPLNTCDSDEEEDGEREGGAMLPGEWAGMVTLFMRQGVVVSYCQVNTVYKWIDNV